MQDPASHSASASPRTSIVEDLFVESLAVPEAERAQLFAARNATDEERAAARRMLAAYESSAGRVDAAMGALRAELGEALSAGAGSAGRYVLLHPLGEGGFGEVFLGRQEQPVRRLVAIKVLRDALGSPAAHARFMAEQQAIASLDHPGIAGMLDSGERADGRPWFAMPYVPGLAVTDFVRARTLSVRARVELMVRICDAVEHAHRRGVIHRDLKPANILVSDDDGAIRPRVIDFGVARMADAAFGDARARTVEGALVGTPEYLSPEQADATPPDTRSDVFSLGVVLYELLAGGLPRDAHVLRAGGRAGLAAAIRSNVPSAPSRFAPEVRPIDADLDAIALCAVAADPAERYQSVGDFRADLVRWLDGDTPAAARPSRLGRAWRFVRRHRVAVGTVAAVIAVLIGATAYSAQQAHIAEIARAEAQRRAEQNAHVLQYVTGVLAGADPTAEEGRDDVTVREKLEAAARDLDGGALRDAPLEAAEIRQALGDAFAGIGRVEDAVAQYRAGMDAVAAVPEGRALECRLAVQCAAALANAQRGADAVVVAGRARDAAAATLDAVLLAKSLSTLADAQRVEAKDLDVARANALESVRLLRAAPGAPREELAAALNNLGLVLFDAGDLDAGIATTEEAIAINKELGKEGGYKAMFDLHNLGQIERTAGRLDAAEGHAREALAIVDRLAGTSHPHRASVLGSLALIKRAKKEFAAGEQFEREALKVLLDAGRGASPDAGIAWLNLASLLRDQDKLPEAIDAGREAVKVLDGVPGQDPWLRAAARMSLGRALTASKRFPEAEPVLQEAWGLLEPLGIDPKRRSSGLLALCQLYKAWNAADAAACPDAKLESCRDRVKAFEAEHPGAIPAGSY